ncbi:hypothetical protein AB205_0023980, partial [Aquarana catesbeiana]
MDAERLECMSCVQPVLSPAEEEDSWEGSDETVDDQEGREQQEVSDPQFLQTPQLGKDVTCDLKPCIQPFKAWAPTVYSCFGKENLWFAGYEIIIQESFEGYAGVIWPAVSSAFYYVITTSVHFTPCMFMYLFGTS